DRRPGVVAEGAARAGCERRGDGEGDGAGDRRREGGDRAVRNRLRAGLGGPLGGDSKADFGRGDAARLGCGRGAYRECLERPWLYPSISYWSTSEPHGRVDRADIRESTCGFTQRCRQDR